jgi:phage tail-like protein
MVAMNLPGSQIATVSRLRREKLGPAYEPSKYPDYGIAARFDVKVGNLGIGQWSSCGGLGVAFNPEEIKTGGIYGQSQLYPGRASWSEVTLERGMDAENHGKLAKLLEDFSKSWVNWTGGSTKPSYEVQDVTITLLAGTAKEPIAEWILHDAVIKSWSGPSLAGGKNEVATEKLVFAHAGFWSKEPNPPTVLLQHAQTAKYVQFEYFPEKYGISQGIQTDDDSGVQFVEKESHVTKVNERKISLTRLRIAGRVQVEAGVNQLFEWLIPEQMASASEAAESTDGEQGTEAKGKTSKGKPAELEITMGSNGGVTKLAVGLREVKVDFTRFNSNGAPIVAEIDLTLVQTLPKQPFLNPTSGGRSANRAHRITAGDNLQRIAQATYHDPNAWRMIAATNGVDDPLRIATGNVLLLPGTAD